MDNSTKRITKDKSIPQKYILPKHIDRYYTDYFSELKDGLSEKSKKIYAKHYGINAEQLNRIDDFRHLGAIETYKAPHILIKEDLKEWRVCASFVKEVCSFNSKVLGFHHNDEKMLKGLTCYLNSKLAAYFLFMISASIGIEREELKPNEYYQLPFSFKDDDMYSLVENLDKYLNLSIFEQSNQIDIFESQIDNLIFSLCNISEKNKFLISDAFEYSFSLLIEGVNSKAFHRVISDENMAYAKMLRQELNNFYSEASYKINITVYDVQRHDPLNLVVLHFCKEEKPIEKKQANELSSLLKELDKYSIQEKGKNLYVQKQFRYYDRDKIYLIKPNQKRFWTRSQAIDDALSLIVEIANMETK